MDQGEHFFKKIMKNTSKFLLVVFFVFFLIFVFYTDFSVNTQYVKDYCVENNLPCNNLQRKFTPYPFTFLAPKNTRYFESDTHYFRVRNLIFSHEVDSIEKNK